MHHLSQLLDSKFGDKEAVIDRSGHYSYSDIQIISGRVAKWLDSFRVKTGDRVIICGKNSSRIVAAIFGITKVEGVFVPINPETPINRFDFICQDCTPEAFILDAELVEKFGDLLRKINKPILILTDDLEFSFFECCITNWSTLFNLPKFISSINYEENNLAAIIYTSGSSKDPRGVMLPHRQILFATTAINNVLGNSSGDVILCGLPLSFDYGLYQIFLAFQVGAKLVIEPDFHIPMVIPRLINMHGVTGFPGVPSLFGMLLRSNLLERSNLPSLRYITSTGDVFPHSYITRLHELLPHVTIFPMYGLTECKRVSIIPKDQLTGHESSVGLPLPGTDVYIVDELGNKLPKGETGELVVRGPHIMKGYWNNPEETAHRFRVDQESGKQLLYTGDTFRIDDEGFLYFIGRREMFIKSRGQKISPVEIESVLYQLKEVLEVVVVGKPDLILGEAICAFISTSIPESVAQEKILGHCRKTLPQTYIPNTIVFMRLLPKTANGKIDRSFLARFALEKNFEERSIFRK